MSKKVMIWANLVPLVLSLLLLGTVLFFAPVCQGHLVLANGMETPMKCFYTGKASLLFALVLFIVSAENLLMKRTAPLTYLVIGIILFILPLTSILGIGVCMKETMQCQTTAIWLRVIGILTIASGIGSFLVKGKYEVE